MELERRKAVLARHGATAGDFEALLAYTENAFFVTENHLEDSYPLPDDASVATWQRYVEEAGNDVFAYLRARLPQLAFPVREGISDDPSYRSATRRGAAPSGPDAELGLRLRRPNALRLFLHPSPAGRVPVLLTAHRDDFESLLRAFTARNEPVPVPPAVGATMVAGYNNWDRVHSLRSAWQQKHPFGDWAAAWKQIAADKSQYQDRFILASSGVYSGVDGGALGIDPATWLDRSVTLRVEHECVHHFTQRVFGAMKNALHDELIADYVGIISAFGRFRSSWLLHFLGLEHPDHLRPSGRLSRYRGEPPLDDRGFPVLQSLVRTAASNLEQASPADARVRDDLAARARIICVLAGTPLEGLADPERITYLRTSLAQAVGRSGDAP